MNKTLGQIAFEAAPKRFVEWSVISPEYQQEWEGVASAVAAAVKEEDAKLCDRFAEREMHPAECAAAIRASIKP